MIKIGVTGHRNLKERCVPFYRAKIYDMLKALKKKYEKVQIYSALAEGADRLVVEVAKELGMAYVAVLPIPEEIYSTDYDETSKDIFQKLLAQAVSVIEIPLVAGNTLSSVLKDSEERNLQYEAAGHFISDHCDVLMALWDGVYTGQTGGTGALVEYHLAKPRYALYHLSVSRSDGLTNDMIECEVNEKWMKKHGLIRNRKTVAKI